MTSVCLNTIRTQSGVVCQLFAVKIDSIFIIHQSITLVFVCVRAEKFSSVGLQLARPGTACSRKQALNVQSAPQQPLTRKKMNFCAEKYEHITHAQAV
jgi:hypothetical protein